MQVDPLHLTKRSRALALQLGIVFERDSKRGRQLVLPLRAMNGMKQKALFHAPLQGAPTGEINHSNKDVCFLSFEFCNKKVILQLSPIGIIQSNMLYIILIYFYLYTFTT